MNILAKVFFLREVHRKSKFKHFVKFSQCDNWLKVTCSPIKNGPIHALLCRKFRLLLMPYPHYIVFRLICRPFVQSNPYSPAIA